MFNQLVFLPTQNLIMMKKISLVLGLLFLSGLLFSQGSIRGKIIDADGEPMPYCTIALKTNQILDGTTTDFDGWFDFKGLTSGTYALELSHIGYHTQNIVNINVSNGKISFIETVTMISDVEMITTVVIDGSKPLIDPNDPSCVTLETHELEVLPSNRNLTDMLTAVSVDIKKSDDGKGFIVRGSRPNSSAIYVDGVKTREANPSVNGSNIKSMQVFTGGIPAAYGDITGGVVVIETKSYFDYYYSAKYKE